MSKNSINFKAGSYIEGGAIISPSNMVTVSFFIKGDISSANSWHTVLGFNEGRYNLYLMNTTTIKGFGFNTWSSDIRGIGDVSKILDNNVHHILAIFTGNTATDELWIDGEKQSISLITGTVNTSNMTVNNTRFFISRGSVYPTTLDGQNFNGNIDDISIWDGKVSVEEALSQKGKVGSKIAYYNMDNLSNSNNVTELVSKLSYSIVGSTWSWDKELVVFNYLAIKNPTTNEHYSLAENTLIHMPDNSTKNMILHGIEQGKEIQLDVPFDKHRYFNDTPVTNVSGKVFTQGISKINTLNIREIRDKDFKPIYTWYETNMTANNAPSPLIASASSEFSTTLASWKAYNGTISVNTDAWCTLSGQARNSHITLDFGTSKEISTISITPRFIAQLDQTPKDFDLQISNDGQSFTTVQSFSYTLWTPQVGVAFDLTEKVTSRFFRLFIRENMGNANFTGIGEIRFGNKREVN